MRSLVVLLALLPAMGYAQGRFVTTTGDVSLSGTGTTLTVQQPATNFSRVTLEQAVVYCSVACNITQTQNGTAATATAGAFASIIPSNATAKLTAWTASNVGAGTSVGGIIHLAAGQTIVLDLSKVSMSVGGTGVNYSIVISSITGVANISLYEVEQ